MVVIQKLKLRRVKSRSFDFGLKTFLTCSDGTKIESPQFFKQSLNSITKASRQHSKKLKGSSNRERSRKNLVRKYEDISHRRRDWFWKLAHELTDKFDLLCFETLNLKGMQRLWGRKISDLAFGEFLQILEWVAKNKKKLVIFIDQWYPSSKTCSSCGQVLESLDLSAREWRCPFCQSVNGRDENASKNICAVGASTVGLGDVRQALACNCCLSLESPCL
ncbi:transposase [Microcoleus sp. ARI1-B5]